MKNWFLASAIVLFLLAAGTAVALFPMLGAIVLGVVVLWLLVRLVKNLLDE